MTMDATEVQGTDAPTTKREREAAEANAKESAEAQALAILMRVKNGTFTERQAKERKEQFLALMADVDDETFRLMLADDEVQAAVQKMGMASGGKPGDPIYDDKGRQVDFVPWTADAQREHYPTVEWTPRRTEVFDFNGVPWQVYADRVNKTPSCIRDIALETYARRSYAENQVASLVADTPLAAAMEGTTFDVGWYKMSPAEIEKSPGWGDV